MNENIREPDKIIRDCLLDYNNNYKSYNNHNDDIYNNQINEAIQISMKDIININDEQSTYEKNIIENHEKITKERKELFSEFLKIINRIKKYDNKIMEIYEIIEPIIELYCNQHIEYFEVDQKTRDTIFNSLKSIRLNKNIIEILEKIIVLSI